MHANLPGSELHEPRSHQSLLLLHRHCGMNADNQWDFEIGLARMAVEAAVAQVVPHS